MNQSLLRAGVEKFNSNYALEDLTSTSESSSGKQIDSGSRISGTLAFVNRYIESISDYNHNGDVLLESPNHRTISMSRGKRVTDNIEDNKRNNDQNLSDFDLLNNWD